MQGNVPMSSPYMEALKLMKGSPAMGKPGAPQLQAPRSLGQGDNAAPWIHDQGARAAMMAQEAMRGGAGMPSTMMNKGNYGGFEDNYFREARPNMPLAPSTPAIPAVGGNMGAFQGNPDNYFRESQMNSPFGRSPAMAKMGAAPKAQNIAIPKRSQTLSPGIRADGSRIDYSKKPKAARK